MTYKAYYCGELDHTFTDNDKESVQHMNNCLADPMNDIWDFEDENGKTMFPTYGGDGCASVCGGNYSSSAPWNAPGMSVSDFI